MNTPGCCETANAFYAQQDKFPKTSDNVNFSQFENAVFPSSDFSKYEDINSKNKEITYEELRELLPEETPREILIHIIEGDPIPDRSETKSRHPRIVSTEIDSINRSLMIGLENGQVIKLHWYSPETQPDADTCGTTCAAMIITSLVKHVATTWDITRKCYTNQDGTTMRRLVNVLQNYYGLEAFAAENASIEMLYEYLDQGFSIIAFIQAWARNPLKVNYAVDVENGHYVIPIGYADVILDGDDKPTHVIYFNDPGMTGIGLLTEKDFLKRWHGEDWEWDEMNRKNPKGHHYIHPLIVVKPTDKKTNIELNQIE